MLLVLAVGAAALLACELAAAALRDCKPAEETAYVVFLSEPEFSPSAFASREEMLSRFFTGLQLQLHQDSDLAMAGLDDKLRKETQFSVALCAGRVPRIDGSEFTSDVASHLFSRNVVVEIWGRLDRRPDGAKQPKPSAQINYLIVPIHSGVLPGSDQVPGLHRFQYPDREIVANDFIELVSNADLRAFVASAIGVSAFFGAKHDVAYPVLCGSVSELERIERRIAASAGAQSQVRRIGELRAYLTGLAGQSLVAARKLKPQLILVDPANPCPRPQ